MEEDGEVDVSKGLPSTKRSSRDSSQLSSKESTCFAVGEFLVVVVLLPKPNRSESKSPIEPNVLEARSLALVRRVRVRVDVPG